MKKHSWKTPLALAAISAGLTALPAHAVEVAFSGGSNIGNLAAVVGTDGIGDTWQTHNGALLLNSSFTMADLNAAPQPFNPTHFSNGFGDFANSFQLTLNNSQLGQGFRGISLATSSSGMTNNFIVRPELLNPASWVAWDIAYNLLDSVSGLYQQVLFTAPTGTRLAQGTNFSANVNFAGIMTADSSWAASFDDRGQLATVPEPGTIALLSLGLIGLGGLARFKRS